MVNVVLYGFHFNKKNNNKACLAPTVPTAQDATEAERRGASLKQGKLSGGIISKPRPESQVGFKLSREGRCGWGKERGRENYSRKMCI